MAGWMQAARAPGTNDSQPTPKNGGDAWTLSAITLKTRFVVSMRPLTSEVVEAHPWATDALAYLDRRRGSGVNGDCPLPMRSAGTPACRPLVGAFP